MTHIILAFGAALCYNGDIIFGREMIVYRTTCVVQFIIINYKLQIASGFAATNF